MAKLNRDVFTLTLGTRQIPPRALILSKKKKGLKFKQYHRRLKENCDFSLSMLSMTDGIPTVAELMDSPPAKYITLAANDCGYSVTAEELIVTYIHPLFLKVLLLQVGWIILVGRKPLEASLLMSIGKPWSWRLLPWKLWVHGKSWSMT